MFDRVLNTGMEYPVDTDVNWTYIRRSEAVQDVFWTSYVRWIYVLCLLGRCSWLKQYRNLDDKSESLQRNAKSKISSFLKMQFYEFRILTSIILYSVHLFVALQ